MASSMSLSNLQLTVNLQVHAKFQQISVNTVAIVTLGNYLCVEKLNIRKQIAL